MISVRLLIKGRVQGVFYRASALEQAENLAISGWVRNTEEGHVECLASGTEESVNAFIAWCRRGPSAAQVTAVDVSPAESHAGSGFHIIRG